jgi:ketosteroid isomerase-like protein
MSEDVTWVIPGTLKTSGVKQGKAEVGRLRRQNLDVFVELDRKIVGLYADGNTVIIEAEAKGRLKNGNVYDNAGCSVWEIKDGKICSVREYVDTMKAAALSELY